MSLRNAFRLCLAFGTFLALGRANAIIVNTDNDADNGSDGVCSLREAIVAVNAAADYHECHGADGGADYVMLAIPPNGGEAHQIALTQALPAITHHIGIDGGLQSGTTCAPVPHVRVQIANPNHLASDGLVLGAGSDYSSIGSIGVSGFASGAGIRIGSTYVAIACAMIGTDFAGAVAAPNYWGVYVDADYARIGLVDSVNWLPNLVSGNSFANVWITSNAHGTLIAGNRIGVDASGLLPLVGGYGIYDRGNGTQIGSGFTDGDPARQRNIVGVKDNGVNVSVDIDAEQSVALTVSGNYIGVGADGHTTLPTLGSRIVISNASGTLIGCDGTSSWDSCRNVIANGVVGNSIENYASGAAIVSNFIGIAADGVTALTPGISSSAGILVGADTLVARNLVSTGAAGIALSNFSGATPVFLNGVQAGSGGATLASSGNCVQGNPQGGVVVKFGTPTPTTFSNNWWGAANGPSPGGSGDFVQANVTATPFLTAPSPYCGFDHVFGNGFE